MDIQEIYNRLKLADKEDCLIKLSDPTWKNKISFPSRLLRLFEKNELLKTLDAFFCFDNKPLVLFFANCENKQALHKAIWNLNESPIVIIIENNAIEIYNGYNLNKETKLLERIGGADKLSDFDYFELVTGKTWEKYQNDLSRKNRVDYKLLNNIEAAQNLLSQHGLERSLANALIGKIIFCRYLIDRKIRLNYDGKEIWTNEDLCNCLKSKNKFLAFVKYLEQKFNGDMFRIKQEDYQSISQAILNILIRLLESEELKSGQRSLFNLYDFSILPIEFISNVYEKFIGKENQEQEGAYYTPTFLVDYIVEATVGKKLKESKDYNCKVLDPACGSGIFLVESLRRIIEKYKNHTNNIHTDTDEYRNQLRELVKNNIFGIDMDKNAIQVAIFSIDLTLLDYQDPADIEKFRFPNLLGTNFICSDTFDIENNDLKSFEEGKMHFDFIIGNPPWRRGGVEQGSVCEKYLKERKLFNCIGNKEIAQAFVMRSMDFATHNTQCALVLLSKILYNINAKSKKFRSSILDKLLIQEVFELSAVNEEIFNKSNDPSYAPSCILFYKNAFGKSTANNIITHIALKPSRFFTLFKIFSLAKNDIQFIQQDRLKNNDWLWKVLVYGSYLDYIFIKRLKNIRTISDIISDKKRFVFGTGVQESSNPKYDSTHLCKKNFIEPDAINNYKIDRTKIVPFSKKRLHRLRNEELFVPPMLLCKKGLNTDSLSLKSAICDFETIFKDSITSIKAYERKDIATLKNISCIGTSNIYSYLAILTFPSIGIERPQSYNGDRFDVPYVLLSKDYYKEFENIYNNDNYLVDNAKDTELYKKKNELNKEIEEKLNFSQVEKDLIDFTINITIPLSIKRYDIQKIFSTIRENEDTLTKYAQVYIDRFANSFNRNGKRFVAEICHSHQIIGMKFRIIDEKDYTQDIKFFQFNMSEFTLEINLSVERKTDSLFVQKDIRGFERDFFYIIKPNERRLWHRAIAHLDVNEFDDAILKAGRNK